MFGGPVHFGLEGGKVGGLMLVFLYVLYSLVRASCMRNRKMERRTDHLDLSL